MEYVAISPRPVRCYVFRFLHRLVLSQLGLDGFKLPVMRVLVDLLKAMEKGGKGFLDALLESIRKPYKSTMGAIGG